MWIRSQDGKALINATRIILHRRYAHNRTIEHVISIINQVSLGETTNEYDVLGDYATEERAIAIIDEIQERICEIEHGKLFPNDGITDAVYQMPKE